MTILQAIILGIVQGLTEFLPISSSGHLIIVPWLFNWHFLLDNPELNKTFDVALHLGTFFSLVVYFWRDIGRLLAAWVRTIGTAQPGRPRGRLAWLIIVSTVPAAIIGVAFEDFIVTSWDSRGSSPCHDRVRPRDVARRPHREARPRPRRADAGPAPLIIGIAQALALCPGVSRSGITMITGLLLRLNREAAARYSFLMSIPVIGGAAAYKGLESPATACPRARRRRSRPASPRRRSAASSPIWFMLAYLKRHNFDLFVLYRIASASAC